VLWSVTVQARRQTAEGHTTTLQRNSLCRLIEVPAKVQDNVTQVLTRALWHAWNGQPFTVELVIRGELPEDNALSDLPPALSHGITVQRTTDSEPSSPSSPDSSTPALGTTSNHGSPEGFPSE
jgi:hypothetical protein